MPKGPLGGPRPFTQSKLVVVVNTDVNIDSGGDTIQRVVRDIENHVGKPVGDREIDLTRNQLRFVIEDGRISPKEATAIGEMAMAAYHNDDFSVVIITGD